MMDGLGRIRSDGVSGRFVPVDMAMGVVLLRQGDL